MIFDAWPAILGSAAVTVVLAAWLRGRGFAVFVSILIGIHSLIATALWPAWNTAGVHIGAIGLQFAACAYVLGLAYPRMRPLPYRVLISWPGQWFVASTFLAFPWAIFQGITGHAPGWWLPYVAGALGWIQSMWTRRDTVDVVLDRINVPGLSRRAFGDARVARPLRIVQISDPHLGPFMTVARLRGIAQRAVEANPDLVLLTGDYLTMESKQVPGCLAEALAPLRAVEGKVFACRGNHDHESPAMIARELSAVGVRLLIDEAVVVETAAGPVQIVGADFQWRDRSAHLSGISERYPRLADTLRLWLLHDPGAFVHLPDGEADLVLSGHTHGGHVGLVSLGLNWTTIGALSTIPDHGFWSHGQNRLFVHRGTGHYGFPLRVGVPGEESVMQIHRPSMSPVSRGEPSQTVAEP